MVRGAVVIMLLFSSACDQNPAAIHSLRVLLDQPPSTLHPFRALDSTSQRIGSLLFMGLTQKNADLEAIPGLALSWTSEESGKTWHFQLNPHLKDHQGQAIRAQDVLQCMENYRNTKPLTVPASSMPYWLGTQLNKNQLSFLLKQPDVDFPKNASLLRFFRAVGKSEACPQSQASSLVTSGTHRPLSKVLDQLHPETEFSLASVEDPKKELRFLFVTDESTRALMLLRGDADVAHNALSLPKTDWFERKKSKDFDLVQRQGVNVSYLAFNLRDPQLKNIQLRRAISLAIDRPSFVKHRMFGFGSIANSFLAPQLLFSHSPDFPFHVSTANQILDEAGFNRDPSGKRLDLKFKTTSSRIGMEQALVIKDMLKKIGVELEVEVTEPAVYYSAIDSGNFQLYASRWVGVSDASIFYLALHSQQKRNRVGYQDTKMDQLLEQAAATLDLKSRNALYREIQKKMLQDLPYFPLWFWNNTSVMNRLWSGLENHDLSLAGSLEPLSQLKKVKIQ